MLKLGPTVTVHALEIIPDPSVEAAVICAVPAETPVTAPDTESTVAILGSLETQSRVGFVALAGATVAISVIVEPIETDAVLGRDIPVII